MKSTVVRFQRYSVNCSLRLTLGIAEEPEKFPRSIPICLPTQMISSISDNVYIIGTMNDIDRSVDSFDFAMRRRFRFVELRADERLEMLASLENEDLEAEAIRRMSALNKEIAAVEDLNENYQIGASYFLKLKTLDFDQLWTDYLQPLLQEYLQGMYDEEGIMNRFAKAYGYQKPAEGDVNETTQD